MASKQSSSLADSIFGGGFTDSTGIFGKNPTAAETIPTKRQKRQEKEEETPSTTSAKTPQEKWEERRKKYAPTEEEEQEETVSFALERAQTSRVPEDAFAEEISSTLKTYGLAVVQKALDPAILERLQQRADYQRTQICEALEKRHLTYNEAQNNAQEIRYKEVVVRCKGRMDARYRYDVHIPPQDPHLPCTNFWADHALLHKIIGRLLYGEEHTPQLVYAGWIFSFPDSADQPWHQDGIPLFPGDNGICPHLPPYAVNVFCPLTDDDGSLEAGPTEFVVGSHRMNVRQAMQATKSNTPCGSNVACPVLKQGDILLYDYRICHRGTANLTHHAAVLQEVADAMNTDDDDNSKGRVRTILYLMYARPWFQEHLNFGTDKLFDDN